MLRPYVSHPKASLTTGCFARLAFRSCDQACYTVSSAETDDDAVALLETEQFDLILQGRKSQVPKTGLAQRLREKHPNLLILKIQPAGDVVSLFPTRTTDAVPDHVLSALKEMLGP